MKTLEVFKSDNTVGVLFVPLEEKEKANNLAASLNECLGIPLGRMEMGIYHHEYVYILAIQGVTKKKIIAHIKENYPEYRVISTVRKG